MQHTKDVIISSKLCSDDIVRGSIELLSGKFVTSAKVADCLSLKPFNLKEESIQEISFDSNKVLTLEQVSALLSYCDKNKEKILDKYYLTKVENGYSLSKLGKNEVCGYADNNTLTEFIEINCPHIKLIPQSINTFKDSLGVLSGDNLLLKILEHINIIDSFLEILYPFYKDCLSNIKTAFVQHIEKITLDEYSLNSIDDINTKIFKLINSIERQNDDIIRVVREKILIKVKESVVKLTDINLQHTVEVNETKYPLSKLMPNEDKLAVIVDELKDRTEDQVDTMFAESLFGSEVDEGLASVVFNSLNSEKVILENGTQLAFVLEYSKANNIINKLNCKVHDASALSSCHEIDRVWFAKDEVYIDKAHVLNNKYADINRYLLLPYVFGEDLDGKITKNFDDFEYLKSEMTCDDTYELLDYVFGLYKTNKVITPNNLSYLRDALGLNNGQYVLSVEYALDAEKCPQSISNWGYQSNTEERIKFIVSTFGIYYEDSNIVKLRTFLATGAISPIDNIDTHLSSMLCNWISEKKLNLTDKQFAVLQEYIDASDYYISTVFNKLQECATDDNIILQFGEYSIYRYDSLIPRNITIKSSGYVFHSYEEGDIEVYGDSIFVSESSIPQLQKLMQSIVNSSGFNADDFIKFLEAYQSMVSGTLEGENDEDPEDDARKAANDLAVKEAINWLEAKGYNTSHVIRNMSILDGVSKRNTTYHLVVKSFRSKKHELKLNPNEWLHLLKINARLMLYLGHMSFSVIDRETLLGNHDFLRLRISSSNFRIENGKLDYTITQLAENIQMFERTHFVFEHISDGILAKSTSLDGYGIYKCHDNEEFTAGNEEDIE